MRGVGLAEKAPDPSFPFDLNDIDGMGGGDDDDDEDWVDDPRFGAVFGGMPL